MMMMMMMTSVSRRPFYKRAVRMVSYVTNGSFDRFPSLRTEDALAQRLKKNAQFMKTVEALGRVNSRERTLVAVRELLPSHPAADPTITMDIHQRRLEEARRRRNETGA